MSESCKEADIPDPSDRSGPKCREMFGGSGNSPLPQELSVLISAKRMSRLSANWKRLCSKFCVSHRIRDEFGQRDHPIMCALVAQARGGRRFEPVHPLLRWRLCGSMSRRNSMTLARLPAWRRALSGYAARYAPAVSTTNSRAVALHASSVVRIEMSIGRVPESTTGSWPHRSTGTAVHAPPGTSARTEDLRTRPWRAPFRTS